MAWITRTTYTGNGSQTDYTIGFPYLAQGDVYVYINDILQTSGYSFPSSTIIRFSSPPAGGSPGPAARIVFRRKTDKTVITTIAFGGTPSTSELNSILKRVQYLVQEAADAALEGTLTLLSDNTWDAQNNRIINVANGIGANDAVNLTQLNGMQPLNAILTAISGLTTAADKMIYFTGSAVAAVNTITSFGRSLVAAVDAGATRTLLGLGSLATLNTINNSNWSGTALTVGNGGTNATTAAGARTNLGVAIGTDVQAYDATLNTIAALTPTTDQMIYFTGTDTAATFATTTYARSLLGGIDAASVRTLLGLGSLSTLSSINNSNWSGTALAIANGGTGQTTANAALNAFLPTQTGNSGKYLQTDGTNSSWVAAAGSGTVTSVATGGLATGGPITGSGTVTVTAASTGDAVTSTNTTRAITSSCLAPMNLMGANVASASVPTLLLDGNYFNVTGTTTITGLDQSSSLVAGREVELKFAGALTLTHNATSFILPGGANITTAAGDVATFRCEDATNKYWRCTKYTKADGTPVVAAGAGSLIGYTVITTTGTSTYTTNPSASAILVELQAGGGGGSANNNTYGGGAGGYSRKFISSPASSYSVTVGTGGARGGTTGGAGGSSSFGAVCSATGGGAGGATAGTHGLGGTGVGGDINVTGGSGANCGSTAGTNQAGAGGSSFFGGGGYSTTAGAYGSGGSGGSAANAAGGQGVVIVWEYA